jgi:hypothetical protein
MRQLSKISYLLYSFGIIAVGLHQVIIKDFRPEILPPFPAWAHAHSIFPILTGITLICAGILIAGFKSRNACLFLGVLFLALIIVFQLPYILFMNPLKPAHLVAWFGAGEELAYSGGAFVMAGLLAGRPSALGSVFFLPADYHVWMQSFCVSG